MSQNIETIADELTFVMPRIVRTLTSRSAHSVNLPPAQIFVLLELQEKEICRVSSLTTALHISAPTVSGIVDRLEKTGYVFREQDKEDRRVVNIKLTQAGQEAVTQIRQSIKERWGIILEKIPFADAETYLRIVKQIQEHLESL